ncbi:MAG: gliding motility lipoprotein GldD [Marinilabiliales bacterium]|nr:MAG: gliding motility lipoprotein GldD [Marinilabiliales bacterium]
MKHPTTAIAFISAAVLTFVSCTGEYSPRPRGYFRIDFPEREYITYEGDCPFTFSYPAFAEINDDDGRLAHPCWFNIDFPGYRGRLHISYSEIDNNLVDYLEDARKLAFRHTVKADAIDERMFINRADDVYGTLYDIKGNAASAVQFYLTDSSSHFFRGALYFNVTPNRDSLDPVIDYFIEDIIYLMESFAWK